MPPSTAGPPFDQFLASAEAVARARPEVDVEMTREVFLEAATLLHNGLVLDGLDEHDARAVVAGLCLDLVAEDPDARVRARSRATLEHPGDLHDPEARGGGREWFHAWGDDAPPWPDGAHPLSTSAERARHCTTSRTARW